MVRGAGVYACGVSQWCEGQGYIPASRAPCSTCPPPLRARGRRAAPPPPPPACVSPKGARYVNG
eukprot:5332798-Pyramimonas_sp.AAC.1